MLTPKQKDLLLFIHKRVSETGVPPSFDEMKDALQLKSKSGIHRLITALEERGFIRRLPHRARAMEVVRLPENMSGEPIPASTHPAMTRAEGASAMGAAAEIGPAAGQRPGTARGPAHARGVGFPSAPAPMSTDAHDSGTVRVPLMGRIAAGVPISAIQDHSADLSIPPDLAARGEHYALEVRGDSMIEAGIHDGDLVIIRKGETANNGDIVVALIDQEEATLKTLRKTGAQVALEAANPNYETRVFGPDQVDIQGRLVGLIRRY